MVSGFASISRPETLEDSSPIRDRQVWMRSALPGPDSQRDKAPSAARIGQWMRSARPDPGSRSGIVTGGRRLAPRPQEPTPDRIAHAHMARSSVASCPRLLIELVGLSTRAPGRASAEPSSPLLTALRLPPVPASDRGRSGSISQSHLSTAKTRAPDAGASRQPIHEPPRHQPLEHEGNSR